jgi:hypothetical protein
MNCRFHLICALLIALTGTTGPAWAGEYVVLENGFRIHAERHETDGAVIRVFDGGGIAELPATSVASFEQEEPKPAPSPDPVVCRRALRD